MAEISPEALNMALNNYFREINLSHNGPKDERSLHIIRAKAMRDFAYDLEILNDFSNNEICEAARKAKRGK